MVDRLLNLIQRAGRLREGDKAAIANVDFFMLALQFSSLSCLFLYLPQLYDGISLFFQRQKQI